MNILTKNEELAQKLEEIQKKYDYSNYDYALAIGISERTLKEFKKWPDKKFTKTVLNKLASYVEAELKEPIILSLQDIIFLRAQNDGLKTQNDSLQKENNKYKTALLAIYKRCEIFDAGINYDIEEIIDEVLDEQ